MTLRGEEEGIGDAVSARSRTTIELLARQPATAELQIRTHQTTLYTSIVRVDDEMIANFHICGSPEDLWSKRVGLLITKRCGLGEFGWGLMTGHFR
jgi:hypothetical protein